MTQLNDELVLSTVNQPFGIDDEYGLNGTLAEFYHAHVSGNQGIYSIRGQNPIYGLHLIKENMHIKITLLIYPTIEDLKREIKKIRPKYFGVSVNIPTLDKGIEMCRIVKEINPQIRTIMGGYGVAVFKDENNNSKDNGRSPNLDKPEVVDWICRGEGVEFLRRNIPGEILNDPIVTPFVPQDQVHILGFKQDPTCYIAPNLGCQEGCEFCSTSHFFKVKTVPLLKTGKDFAKSILDNKEKIKKEYKIKNNFRFSILCEDFFRDKTFFYDFKKELGKSIANENISFNAFVKKGSSLRMTVACDSDMFTSCLDH